MSGQTRDDRVTELMGLLEVPEVRQVMLAKMEQTKVLFQEKIQRYYRQKFPNIIEFPGGTPRHCLAGVGDDRETIFTEQADRQPDHHQHNFFDTTRCLQLPEDDQINIFLQYFYEHREFRRDILSDFFLKKLPYAQAV